MASSKRENRPDAFADMLAALDEVDAVAEPGRLDSAMYGRPSSPIAPAIVEAVKSQALMRGDDGRLRFRGVVMTGIGLEIPKDGISKDTYQEFFKFLLELNKGLQWAIGDMAAYADDFEWGSTYQQLCVDFDLDYQTVRNFASVSRRVKLYLRKYSLTFGHHNIIASMEEVGQRLWLDYAESMKWSIAKMRAFLGLLDVYDVEGQRAWLEVVQADNLTADTLRARLAAAGGHVLAAVDNDRDLVHQMTRTKFVLNVVDRNGIDLVGCGADTVRDVVKAAREMQRLADEILEKHGGGK